MAIKKLLFTALLALGCQALMAQGVRISGTVTDNEGPVMMGNVIEVDANNRIVSNAQTDLNGNFSMQIRSTGNKLKFSYVGDKTKVMSIGNKTVFKVHLEPENAQIGEVVVTSKRQNSSGLMIQKKEISVSQQVFNMEQVEGLAFTSADEALQGEIAGLDIVSNSGNLGSGTQMRLRGVTTITGDANPLIVVDDKIFDNPDENFDFVNANEEQYASLLSVNVEDIASITVLKDAAATAVWGSQGSNGVIQITTKHGVRGKPRVNFSYKFTGTWQPDGYQLLDGDGYTMLMKEEFYNPTQSSTATTNMKELNYDTSWPEYQNWNNNTDWVDAVKQFGAMHDWNVNLTGGGQKATFRISAGYKNQTGSIIKQKFQQFTTRMVLDYNVSDRIRFSTNFALTYTGNNKNYSGLLGIAQKIAPNMNIYRNNSDEFYIMNPASRDADLVATGMYSSNDLNAILGLGNPVAIANLAWAKENTYRLTPDFSIKYELLGTDAESSRLTLNGRVDFDIYANSAPTYCPASLASNKWNSTKYNLSENTETNRIKVGGRVELVFTPYFKNQDWSATMLARYEMSTQKYNKQFVRMNNLPTEITSSTVYAWLPDRDALTSSNSRSASQNLLYNGHVSYKDGRYSLGVSLRADGDSKFGPKNKWAIFPGVSLRYNISDEPFFTAIKGNWLSMLGLRASWGIVGKAPSSNTVFWNTYDTSSNGSYGNANGQMSSFSTAIATARLDGLKLDDLKWEKTTSYNLGFNLGLLNDRLEVDFDYYHKETRDLLMSGIKIPSVTGFTSLSWGNVGRMDNDGWELNLSAKRIIKVGKFSVDASINVAQNSNLIKEMDESVLEALNKNYTKYTDGKTSSEWAISRRGDWPLRVQLNNSLGSIYGFRYKGVFQYTYSYLQNLQKENGWDVATYENEINKMLAEGKTFPIVTNADGTVLMNDQGQPMHRVLNYENNSGSGSQTYTFQGGDAIYEDINNDGQINQLDIVYLGNSLPKVNGGFNFTFRYGNWSVKTRFMYRFGNKVVNLARQNLEKMFDTYNQCATVNYRWRKDGDETPIPRAMYNSGYNFQPSDRYVEDGGFVRFQNLQIAYNFDKKFIKSLGLNKLQAYASLNNLYVWTKYSGVDPEISPQGFGVAADASQTPRSKQFTITLDIGF